jgi:predicted RNA polymerase sigma factor
MTAKGSNVDASDYTQYRPLLFSIAYRMTGSDAEDIVQEAFLRATKDKTRNNEPKNADGGLIAVISLDVLDGQVQAIRTVANPEKLSHLGPLSQVWHLRSRD